MSSLAVQTIYTPEEYLILERKGTLKSEFLNGDIFAISGATLAHTLITVDITTELNIQLRGKDCKVVSNDLRVKTVQLVSYLYPDVVVFCGEPKFEDETFDTLLNPVVIIEVLSPSTEVYDRTEKFEYYKQITTLQEYILVSQDKVKVEHHRLQENQWKIKEHQALQDTFTLSSIGCKLTLSDVYRRVDFD